jgi:hypothetical protein
LLSLAQARRCYRRRKKKELTSALEKILILTWCDLEPLRKELQMAELAKRRSFKLCSEAASS